MKKIAFVLAAMVGLFIAADAQACGGVSVQTFTSSSFSVPVFTNQVFVPQPVFIQQTPVFIQQAPVFFNSGFAASARAGGRRGASAAVVGGGGAAASASVRGGLFGRRKATAAVAVGGGGAASAGRGRR